MSSNQRNDAHFLAFTLGQGHYYPPPTSPPRTPPPQPPTPDANSNTDTDTTDTEMSVPMVTLTTTTTTGHGHNRSLRYEECEWNIMRRIEQRILENAMYLKSGPGHRVVTLTKGTAPALQYMAFVVSHVKGAPNAGTPFPQTSDPKKGREAIAQHAVLVGAFKDSRAEAMESLLMESERVLGVRAFGDK